MAVLNLDGWDAASIASVTFVNAQIISQSASPAALSLDTDVYSVNGTFGTWQMTTGGSSTAVMFMLPLLTIEGTVSSGGQVVDKFSYESLSATVEFQLVFIDTETNQQSLVVDANNPPTVVTALFDSSGTPLANEMDAASINGALIEWLNQNLSAFTYVFSTVTLVPAVAAGETWAFCQPAVADYVAIQGATLAESYLGILYNTGGNTSPGGEPQIDPSCIPANSEAVLLLSPATFLTTFLAPAVSMQLNIPMDDLVIDAAEMTISMAAGVQVSMAPVEANGSSYQPFMTSFSAEIQNSIIYLFAETSTVVYDGFFGTITSYDSSQNWYSLSLSGDAMTYQTAQPGISNHSIEASEEIEIAEDILAAIGIIVLILATILTGGADLIIITIILGMLQGGIQAAEAYIEGNGINVSPSATALIANLSLPIQWGASQNFQATSATIVGGGLVFTGTINSGT